MQFYGLLFYFLGVEVMQKNISLETYKVPAPLTSLIPIATYTCDNNNITKSECRRKIIITCKC